jgi:hypothetical protein
VRRRRWPGRSRRAAHSSPCTAPRSRRPRRGGRRAATASALQHDAVLVPGDLPGEGQDELAGHARERNDRSDRRGSDPPALALGPGGSRRGAATQAALPRESWATTPPEARLVVEEPNGHTQARRSAPTARLRPRAAALLNRRPADSHSCHDHGCDRLREQEPAPGKARLEVPGRADADPERPVRKATRLTWLERTLEEVSPSLAPLPDREPARPSCSAKHDGRDSRLRRAHRGRGRSA